MTTEPSPYLFLAVFLVIAIAFPLAPLALAWLWAKKFSPAKPGHDKNAIYECGLESKGDALIQFRLRAWSRKKRNLDLRKTFYTRNNAW